MTSARETGRPSRPALLYVLGLVGIVAGLVMAFLMPAVGDDGWSKQAKSAESVASGFITSCYSIDTTDVEASTAELKDVVTDSFDTSCLDLLAPSAEEKQVLANSQVTFGNVVVSSTGTTQLDGDSANVVVTFSFTATAPAAASPAPLATRGIVQLVKQGGDWKVNDFSEIPQVEASIGAPTDGSAATPSPEATP